MNNILAAVFIATGQDVACIGESGCAQVMMAPASQEEIESQGRCEALSAGQGLGFLHTETPPKFRLHCVVYGGL